MQLAFYFNQTRCIGCYTCVVACKDWHNVPPGPASWRRVITIEKGKYPIISVAFLSTSCFHCAEPPCMTACPANAITKRKEDGIVTVDRELCLGKHKCGMACKDACPYDAPQFEDEVDAKMEMCNLCLDRWVETKKPICINSCPTRALDAGPIDELHAIYGDIKEAEGFSFSPKLRPSVIFKPK